MESSLQTVAPARPVAPYVGGKRNLSARLVQRINAIPHTAYLEPFVGMGGVFLRRNRRPPVEVINDASSDVANLFRVLQRHYVAFLDMLRFQLTTRAEFERLQRVEPETLTDLERAARFLYLQRTAFGGKVVGQNFGVSFAGGARFDVTKLQPLLEAVHERLAGVVIERLDFEIFIRRYDRPSALFFLDPPYLGSEAMYGANLFSPADFARLRGLLDGLQGRFLLTINATAEARDLFAGFDLEEVGLTYRLSGRPQHVSELIVSGNGDGHQHAQHGAGQLAGDA